MPHVTLRVDADPVQLDRLTSALFRDVRELALVKVAKGRDTAPEGAKSGTGSPIADLVLTGLFSAGTVTAITKVVLAYLERTKARSVTWIDGDKSVLFTGISSDDQRALAQALAASAAKDDEAEPKS
jgi:hypothetical protein